MIAQAALVGHFLKVNKEKMRLNLKCYTCGPNNCFSKVSDIRIKENDTITRLSRTQFSFNMHAFENIMIDVREKIIYTTAEVIMIKSKAIYIY